MSNEQGAAPERHVPWAALGAGVAGIIGYVAWAAARGIVTIGSRGGVDFFVYYQAAAVLRRGEDIYQAGISPPYVYPPLLAVLALPLLGGPIAEALIIWRVVQHACLVIAGGLLVSLLPRHVRPVAVGVLLLGALTVPLHDEI
ncbi:MAG TPA: hypothetical protein VM536_10830, partial [Chloroflexia bacterium]|nr:hypothetical protein [Chloroflexia bacterium]